MVIRGGENIYSSEVENVLYDHPAVTDAAIIGIPHRTLGEEPAAVVHLAPGTSATEAELQQWVRERLAAFKTPVRIVFCEETLPRNANGKILKGAAQVAHRAVVAANAAMKAAKAHPRPAALKGAVTKVGGPPPAAMTPKQKAAVNKHQAAVNKADGAARKAATTGLAAKAAAANQIGRAHV